jgi:hypothetical protein
MNTGIQRSSATPYGASTTTSPAGKISIGQITWKKDLPAIAAAHNIPYVATACPSYPFDLMDKATGYWDVVASSMGSSGTSLINNVGGNGFLITQALSSASNIDNTNLVPNIEEGGLVDAYEKGIIDPTKVVRSAIENAAAAAVTLLMTNGFAMVCGDPLSVIDAIRYPLLGVTLMEALLA